MKLIPIAALLAGCGVPTNTPKIARTAAPMMRAEPVEAGGAIHRSEDTDELEYDLTIPAAAAALPRLREDLISRAENAKAEALREQAVFVRDAPELPARTFSLEHDWTVAGATPPLLSLVGVITAYSGGAHGSAGTIPLLWDRGADREVASDELFTDRAAALATLRDGWCRALEEERRERGAADGDFFSSCPDFSELTVVPSGNVGGRFSRITVIADPYVAGSWAEGEYRADLFIPDAMIPLIAPRWRSAFPG